MKILLPVLIVICIGFVVLTPAAAIFPDEKSNVFLSWFPFSSASPGTSDESGVIAAGLIVISTPAGGDVYVDGALMGKTPCTLPGLPSGIHIVTIRMNGYKDRTRNIIIRDRHTVNLDAVLVPSMVTPVPTITGKPTLPRPSITPLGTPIPYRTHAPVIIPKPTLPRPSISPLGTPIPFHTHSPVIIPKPTLPRPSISPLGTPIHF
jgi:hypothetical protein